VGQDKINKSKKGRGGTTRRGERKERESVQRPHPPLLWRWGSPAVTRIRAVGAKTWKKAQNQVQRKKEEEKKEP